MIKNDGSREEKSVKTPFDGPVTLENQGFPSCHDRENCSEKSLGERVDDGVATPYFEPRSVSDAPSSVVPVFQSFDKIFLCLALLEAI